MTQPRQYRPNVRLLQLESACTELLGESFPPKTEAYKTHLGHMARALEGHGDESFFVADSTPSSRKAVDVLALDLAWLRPGSIGGWSEKGTQAYCWRNKGRSNHKEPLSWYQRALAKFFAGPNASSLLSLFDIYTQERWVHWDWIETAGDKETKHRRRQPGNREQDLGFNICPFLPRTDLRQTPASWENRFDDYRANLRNEIGREFGAAVLKRALLVCVYVSPGTKNDFPPDWGVSLFAVLGFKCSRSDTVCQHHTKRLGVIVSNIYNSLKSAAQKALEAKREQRNLAQAISHEFKNLNQDVANLAGAARNEVCSLSTPMRSRLSRLESHLDALQMAARATTSFCLGTYWLFSTKNVDKTTTMPDDNCYLFRHIMSLAIRLVERSKPNWRLVGIPTEARIVSVLGRGFDPSTSGTLADLVLQPAIAVMLFLALEPVHNIRGSSGSDSVVLRLRAAGKKLTLTQTTFEPQPHSLTRVKSEGVENLMRALADFCPLNLVQIDPWTDIKSSIGKRNGRHLIVKTTTITVHRVISRIAPRETAIERRK